MSSPSGGPPTAAAVERAWEVLWPQLALREGFWLAYLFGSDLNVIRQLTERSENYARMRGQRIEVRWVGEPGGLTAALRWLLTPQADNLALVWVVGVGGEEGRWLPEWSALLRRLNERREVLRGALPCGVALALPDRMLDATRDAAPDLWSYRSAVINLGPVAGQVDAGWGGGESAAAMDAPQRTQVVRGDPHEVAELAVQPAVEPSPAVRGALQEAAQALRAGQLAVAADTGRAALEAAHRTGLNADLALAHTRLARALAAKGDTAGALDHAYRALDLGVPVGLAPTRQLLSILTASPDADIVLAARHIEVDVARLLAGAPDAGGESLRDLSVSLNNVARINRLQGNLDTALTHYTESLNLRHRIRNNYGDTPESLRDLSVSLDNVATVNQLQGNLDTALTHYTESLNLAHRIRNNYGDTPESLRDLSVSLDNVARINQLQGNLDTALTHYTEAIEVYERFDCAFGPPLADAAELAGLRESRGQVEETLRRDAEPRRGNLGRTAAMLRRLTRRRRRT